MMKHYRYFNALEADGTKLYCEIFNVIGETPKCYYVIQQYLSNLDESFKKKYRKRISKTSVKRYCYPTREEALKSFIARKVKHIQKARKFFVIC